ncbi:hypothetical protein GCM10020295_39190 [Streptomyces cinereospinus]
MASGATAGCEKADSSSAAARAAAASSGMLQPLNDVTGVADQGEVGRRRGRYQAGDVGPHGDVTHGEGQVNRFGETPLRW